MLVAVIAGDWSVRDGTQSLNQSPEIAQSGQPVGNRKELGK